MYNSIDQVWKGSLLGLLDDFFTSRRASIPLVFACTCWIKSVLALLGDGGLSRYVKRMKCVRTQGGNGDENFSFALP